MCYFCHAHSCATLMPKRGSCGSVLPGCRLSKQYPSINSPAARCCTSRARRDAHCTLLGFPVGRDPRRLVLAPRLPSRAAPTCDPHSARCSAGCHTSRDFVPWRFLDAGQLSARVFHCCRRPKTSTRPDIRALTSTRAVWKVGHRLSFVVRQHLCGYIAQPVTGLVHDRNRLIAQKQRGICKNDITGLFQTLTIYEIARGG